MPGGDRTGPMGQGPLTGRGLGNCLAYGIPAIAGAVAAFGFGRRRGFGRGFGRAMGWGAGFGRALGWDVGAASTYSNAGAAPTYSRGDELAALKEEAKYLQDRISELEKE